MHLPSNTILNNKQYRIKKVIGQGGFGITYLAEEIGYYRQTGFNDKPEYVEAKVPDIVVIKELYYNDYCQRNQETGLVAISNTEKRVEFSKLVENQLNEGKKLRSLNHPNIVRTRDIFEENGTAYMVMDYVESTDLEELLNKAGKLEKPKALQYITQVLSALTHIHDRNKLHLDIKPSNVLIKNNSDEAIVIDFGASQSYDEGGKIIGKTSQLVAGMTRHYAPNEQADLDNLKHFDATFDTYAAGATLYHLLTGQKPPLSSLLSTGREKLIPPSTFVNNNGVSDYLDAVLAKSLAPMFHERFKSAAEFEGALEKETEYIKRISEIGKLIASKNYQLALSKIETTETNYLQTKSLTDYKKIATSELNKDRLTNEFQKHYSKGLEWLNSKEYNNAIIEFKQALEIFPDNEEVKNKLNYCQLQVAEINKQQEISNLLSKCKAYITNHQYNLAKNALNSLLALNPAHTEAAFLLKDIAKAEDEINAKAWDNLLAAFNNEDYANAIDLKQSINLQKLSKSDIATINLLVEENVLKYKNAYSALNTLETELKTITKNSQSFESKLQALTERYKILLGQVNNLSLPHKKFDTLISNVGIELKAKQEGTVIVTPPTKKENTETTAIPLEQEVSNKSKEKYIYRGILVVIVATIAFLYFKGKSKTIGDKPIPVNTDSLPAMAIDSGNINMAVTNQPDTGTKIAVTPNTTDSKTTDTWKGDFEKKFSEVKRKESSSSPDELFNMYQALYKFVPTTASSERNKVKERVDFWGRKFIEQTQIAETEKRNQLEAQAQSLVNEANNAFKSNLYQLAAEKYSKANSIMQGSGDVGYYKFLEKAKKLYDITDPCAPPYLNRLKEAKSIKSTDEVNNLINKCN